MSTHQKPEKKGDYVTIDGRTYPVTGKIQEAAASGALCQAGRSSAAIQHWDGASWHRTGRTLRAAESCAPKRSRSGGGGADMVPEVPYYLVNNAAWGRPGGGGARTRRGPARRTSRR